MMIAMTPKAAFLFCAPLASVAAGVAVLAELNDRSGASSLFLVMISRLGEVMLLGMFGILAARDSGLKGSVLLTARDWRSALQTVVNHGVLPGFVLGLVNYLFFFYERYSPFVEERIRNMESVYDVLLVSLDAGIFEEVVYRLFVLSCFMLLFRHLYRSIRHVQPTLVSVLPKTMALVLSSLLFGAAHSVTGFTAAFTGGLMLGFIYLRSGVESATAAHISANLLFFSASYLA
jgi:membrane protease YdiL (CAAX protease family)